MQILVPLLIISMYLVVASPFRILPPPLSRPLTRRLLLTASTGDGSGGRSSASVSKLGSPSEASLGQATITSKTEIMTQPVRGTRDFYPSDMRLQNWLFSNFRSVAASYNFVEYDAPLLESLDLYTRKAGDEIVSQLYSFEDQGGRGVALRPEMTPSLARMVLAKAGANGKGLPMPIKWFAIPQCWRYERTTRGRRREHYQWNMDVWGIQGESAEAELITAMVGLFKRMKLTAADVTVKINSRAVVYEVLKANGVRHEMVPALCVLIDKLDKVPLESLALDFNKLGVDLETARRIMQVLSAASLDEIADYLPEDSPGIASLRSLFQFLEANGISENGDGGGESWIKFDGRIIRGLSYYTGCVFEAVDAKGELRAIAGGGRYDGLLESFGGKPTPAVGFGFGDAVIVELLRDRNLLPSFDDDTVKVDYVVYSSDESALPGVFSVAKKLRDGGKSVDTILDARKSKWAFKHADRLGASYVVVVSQSEWKGGVVSVKDMESGEQRNVQISDL